MAERTKQKADAKKPFSMIPDIFQKSVDCRVHTVGLTRSALIKVGN